MNFLLFSTIHWDASDGVHQSPQLARELARLGHPVLFVQPRPSSNIGTAGLPIQIISLQDLGLSAQLVERAWHGLNVGPLDGVAQCLVAKLRAIEKPAEPGISIWFSPFDPFARLLPLVHSRGYHPFYYPVDDFDSMAALGYKRMNPRAEQYLAGQAEIIFAVCEPVARKMRGTGKPVCVVRNGICLEDWQQAPSGGETGREIVTGQRTLGFWGWLSTIMVDPALIEYVARQHPEWAINLIGDLERNPGRVFPVERLSRLPNIRLLGSVDHSRLADLGKRFDACLVPAPDNDFSRGRDPLKVYEYLALHKPVITAHMPQLADMPYVRNGDTPEDFVKAIQTALATEVKPAVVDAYLSRQTWAARADEFLSIVSDHLAQKESRAPEPAAAPGSLVAPSFAGDVPGLAEYLDLVESDLERTRAWAKELEAAARAKQQELERIYSLPPARFIRRLRRLFRRKRS
ncbi:MAG: hypothetical protein ACM3JD_13520 [Rudaea sp.]